MVDPNLAAILAFLFSVVNLIVGAVIIIMTRNNGIQGVKTHDLVNSQTDALVAAATGQARAEGQLAGQTQTVSTKE